MATYLVIASDQHPLHSRLRELVANVGGKAFYFFSSQRKLTSTLFDFLRPGTQLLFLPRKVATVTPLLKEIKTINYGRRAWMATTPKNYFTTLPTVLGSQITSFLTPQVLGQMASTSKEFRDLSRRALLPRKQEYYDLWEDLSKEFNEDLLGSKEEFTQTLLSPKGQAAYQEYHGDSHSQEWELITTHLPPVLVWKFYLRRFPKLRFDKHIAEELIEGIVLEKEASDRQLARIIRLFGVRPPWSRLIRAGRLSVIRLLEDVSYPDLETMKMVTFGSDPYLFHGNQRIFYPLTLKEEKFDREFITATALDVIPWEYIERLATRIDFQTGRPQYPLLQPDRKRTTEGSFITSALIEGKESMDRFQEFVDLVTGYLRWLPSPEELAKVQTRHPTIANYLRSVVK